MASTFDVDAWLGAWLVAAAWTLPTKIADLLKASYAKKKWTAADVPRDEGCLGASFSSR